MSQVNFNVKVTGAAAIAQLNSAIVQYNLNVVKAASANGSMTATIQTTQAGLVGLQRQLAATIPQLDNATKSTKAHQNALLSTVASYLRFRIAAGIFTEVTTAIQSATAAMKEYDLQTSRALRTTAQPNQRGIINAELQYGTATSGRSIKDVGEANYQLTTFIPDVTTRLAAFNDTMKLLTGTQGDARETTRLLIQLYAQFGDQMGSTRTQAQKLHSISEMIATSFKDANAEVGELAQSLKYLGPTAVAARVPLEQVMGVITALTGEGQRGRVSGTGASAIIVNLIKKYNEDLKGVVVGDYVYKFEKVFFKDGPNKGMLDLVSTMEKIADIARHLPTAEADKFITAVGGSNQAIRILGAEESVSAIHNVRVEIEKMQWAAHADKGALEALDATMKETFDVKQARAWNGVINEVTAQFSTLLAKVLGVKDGLDGLNNAFANLSKTRLDVQLDQREMLTETQGIHAERIATFAQMLRQLMMTHPHTDVLGTRMGPADPNEGSSVEDIRRLLMLRAKYEAAQQFGWKPGRGSYQEFGNDIRYPGRSYQIGVTEQSFIQQHNNELNMAIAAMRDQGVALAPGNKISPVILDQLLGKLDAITRIHPPSSERPTGPGGSLPGFGSMYIDPADPRANILWAEHHVKTPAALKKEAAQKAAADRKALEEQIKAATEVKGKLDQELADIMEDNDVDIVSKLNAIKTRWQVATFKLAALKHDARTLTKLSSGHDAWSEDRKQVGDALIGDSQALRRSMFKFYLDEDPKDPQLDKLAKTIDAVDYESARASRDPKRLSAMFDAQHSGALKELKDAREKGKDKDDTPKTQAQYNAAYMQYDMERINLRYQTALGDNELGVRYGMGIDPKDQQRQLIQRNMASTADKLARLKSDRIFEGGKEDNKLETEIAAAAKELNKFAYELSKLDADQAIHKFAETLSAIDRKTSQSKFELGLQGGRGFGQDLDSYKKQQFTPLQGELAIAVRNQQELISAYAKRTLGQGAYTEDEQRAKDEAFQRAANEVATATHNLSTAINDEYNRKYDAAHSSIEGSVNGAILDLAHGRKGAGAAVGAIGTQFFDAAILKFLKPYTDPLIGALSQQLVAVKENTKSINVLTQTMGGTAPNNTAGGAIGGSVNRLSDASTVIGATATLATVFAASANRKGTPPFTPTIDSPWADQSYKPNSSSDHRGAGGGSGGGGAFGGKGFGKAGTYLGYGMAAIGAFQAGQQGGPLTGAISGAMAGASVAGPVGAAVGGVVGLLGGLFGGHHHSAQQDQRDKNPGLFNSPSDFIYDAYRYRATGQYPTAGSLGMTGGAFNGGAAVIINHFSDGVKTATTKALANAVSLGVSGQANHTVDIHSPV